MARVRAFPAADPGHPDHRSAVWGTEHVAAWYGVTSHAVLKWVARGQVPRPAATGATADGKTLRRWRPCDVAAATSLKRVPTPPGGRALPGSASPPPPPTAASPPPGLAVLPGPGPFRGRLAVGERAVAVQVIRVEVRPGGDGLTAAVRLADPTPVRPGAEALLWLDLGAGLSATVRGRVVAADGPTLLLRDARVVLG